MAAFVVSLLGGGNCQIRVVPAASLESKWRSPSVKAAPVTAAGFGSDAILCQPEVDQIRRASPDAPAAR
jgi:hypothetical protein